MTDIRTAWSPERDARLLHLANRSESISQTEMAGVLGTTKDAVKSRLAVLRHYASRPPRKLSPVWSAAEHQTLRCLWDEGLSARVIGDRMHRSKNSVLGAAHRAGLPPRPSPILGVLINEPDRARRAADREARLLMRLTTLPPLLSANELEAHPMSVNRIHIAHEVDAEVEVDAAPISYVASPRYRHECCWPIGDPGRPGFRFCEAPTNGGRIYCPEHHRLGHA